MTSAGRDDTQHATQDSGSGHPVGTHVAAGVDSEHQTAAAAVVAEAVAVALEAAAEAAAEAVLLTAAAVTEAAGRAAAAAVRAKQARALAADAAARSVAREAERTAEQVRDRALAAATRVQDAAALAADELVRRVEGGVVLDAGQLAEVLAGIVRDAAEATAQDTTRAADVVRDADSAAAARVARTHAVDQSLVEREVAAAADAHRELAGATATAVARETDARAASVARAARDAAAALLRDEDAAVTATPPLRPGYWEAAAELSHDLRVPLSSIIASVELLQDELDGHVEEPVAMLLGRAARAGNQMVRMLDHHMTPRTAESTVELEVDLADVVQRLVMDLADVLEPAGAVVETGGLPVVRVDPDAMYSVLQNLLTNSVKFARPGVPTRIRISAERSVDGWRIRVRDNGVGWGDSGPEVFSLFSRGTEAVPGNGIGLATVARVVAEHGGRVGLTPVATGAEIWFELPALS